MFFTCGHTNGVQLCASVYADVGTCVHLYTCTCVTFVQGQSFWSLRAGARVKSQDEEGGDKGHGPVTLWPDLVA